MRRAEESHVFGRGLIQLLCTLDFSKIFWLYPSNVTIILKGLPFSWRNILYIVKGDSDIEQIVYHKKNVIISIIV